MEKFTDKELEIIGHSLGINVYHARLSRKKKDKILPNEFYRNYFCASVEHGEFPILNTLQLNGYMQSWTQYKNLYFAVTEIGIDKFRKEFDEKMSKKLVTK